MSAHHHHASQPLLCKARHLPLSPGTGMHCKEIAYGCPELQSARCLTGFGSACLPAKGTGDKCRSFRVKDGGDMKEKQSVLCAETWRPSWRFTAVQFLWCLVDMNFRACRKRRVIIEREILPVYPHILICTPPVLPHLPLSVLPTQPEQRWISVLPGAVQACRHLLLQYWRCLLSSAGDSTVNLNPGVWRCKPSVQVVCLLLV